MLSPDLVRVRRSGGKISLIPLSSLDRDRAIHLAAHLLKKTKDCLGHNREFFEEQMKQCLFLPPKEKKLALALLKLIEELAIFESEHEEISPEVLRTTLFQAAALARRTDVVFDPEKITQDVALTLGMTPVQIHKHLYSDLKTAKHLVSIHEESPEQLLNRYETCQAQAILLRAVRVTVFVTCSSAAAYRRLFHKIKFFRLLFSIQESALGGYQIDIDGPFSLFESTTKYGLQLALLLPYLYQCQKFRLSAKVLWGKTRTPCTFELSLEDSNHPFPHSLENLQDFPEEISSFLPRFVALDSIFQVITTPDLLSIPGMGICIPDLQFIHKESGETIYLELLGYWSRDAVWNRVELVQKKFPHKILFAVRKRLRVSEDALDETTSGMLYVFNDTLQPKVVLDRLLKLTHRIVK